MAEIFTALLDSPSSRQIFDMFVSEPAKLDVLRTGLDFFSAEVVAPVDPDAEMRTVDLASAEAARLGHPSVGSDHVLLGMLRQPETFTSTLLQSIGMSLDSAR